MDLYDGLIGLGTKISFLVFGDFKVFLNVVFLRLMVFELSGNGNVGSSVIYCGNVCFFSGF